jgi:hypothetical protein
VVSLMEIGGNPFIKKKKKKKIINRS